MIVGLLLIVGSYGLAIAMVHLCYSLMNGNRRRTLTYVLIVKDNELHMEWYLRSLFLFSWLKGRQVKVVLFDEGSIDDTLNIAMRVASARDVEIQVVRVDKSEIIDELALWDDQEEVIVVRLSNESEMQKIPLVQ